MKSPSPSDGQLRRLKKMNGDDLNDDNFMEKYSLERRMSHLEKTVAIYGTLLERNTEILDDIREHINRPVNYQAWVATALATMSVFGALLYAAYIAPMDDRVTRLEMIVDSRKAVIEDYRRTHPEGVDNDN